jgi:site-specific DNA recombinase
VTREQPLDAQGRPQRDAKGRKVFGDDVLVVGDDGSPVVRAEPIITRDVFDRLAVELAGRENRKEPTKRTSGLLLRIIYCAVCGRPAYRLKGGVGRKPRYRCSSAQKADGPCSNKTISLEYADGEVERQVLQNMGPLERKRRVWFTGNDHTDELGDINDTLADLADQLGTGVFKRGTPQRAKLDARIAALSARQDELSSVPSQPAGWRFEPTGELFFDWWAEQEDEGKNIWLRQMGFRWVWSSHSDERGRVVVDRFEQVGELDMDLDADQLFGPIADIVAALSDPAVMASAPRDE